MPRSRRRSTSSSRCTRCRAAASGSGSRRTTSASAASRSPASTTSASSRTRCSSAPTTSSRSPSTRRSSTTACSARRSTRAAPSTGRSCSSPPTASRSSATSRRSARPASSSSASTSRRSRCSAQSASRCRDDISADRRGRRRQRRARAHDARRLGRQRLRVHARPRVGRHEARRRRRPRASRCRVPRPSELAARAFPSSRCHRRTLQADPRCEPAREAVTESYRSLARELVASLEYYQGQPGSLPISEILLAGGTSRIPGLAAELERLTRVRVRLATRSFASRSTQSVEEPRRPGLPGRRNRTGGGGLMRASIFFPSRTGPAMRSATLADHDVGDRRRRGPARDCVPLRRRLVRAEPRQGRRTSSDTLATLEQKTAKLQVDAGRSRGAAGERPGPRGRVHRCRVGARMRWDNLLDDISRVLPTGSWLSSLNMPGGHGGDGHFGHDGPRPRPSRRRSPSRASRSPRTRSPA